MAWVLVCCGGCSLIFHASADQCTTDPDCRARGASFAGYTCNAGTCAPPDAEAGADANLDGMTGNDHSVSSGCNSYTDCPVPADGTTHTEVACDVDTHTCRALTTDECPFVIGDYTGVGGPNGAPDPIFIGAFATLPSGGPMTHPSFLNYQLAQGDFSQGKSGIPAGGGSALRTPVIVVCNDSVANLNVPMQHLVNGVNVSAVIAPLASASLSSLFSAVNLSGDGGHPVFFMNPFGADSTLTPPTLPTNGLLWSMLGQPSDLATAYAAFFPRVEAYVRNTLGAGATRPLRVATVTATSPTVTQDLAKAVTPILSWNGGPAVTGNANYLNVQIPQSYLTHDDLAKIDYATPSTALTNFNPDVIVSFASEELSDLLQYYEGVSGQTPFYLLSAYNDGSSSLLTWIGTRENRRTRFAGINFASLINNPVLTTYQSHFNATFQNAMGEDTAENYYDAVYYTIDAMIAAGRTSSLDGTRLSAAIPHIIDTTNGVSFDVGQADIPNVTQQLYTLGGKDVDLIGTLGSPDFHLATGSRISEGSVYCVSRDTTAPPDGGIPSLALSYSEDVLQLDPDGGMTPDSGPDGGPPALVGTFSCYNGL